MTTSPQQAVERVRAFANVETDAVSIEDLRTLLAELDRTSALRDEAGRVVEVVLEEDHQRLCQGREYTCTCGYDDKLSEAARAFRSKLGVG